MISSGKGKGNEAILIDYGGNIVERRRGACGDGCTKEARRARRTVTNYRYANGAKREDEREEGKMRISRGKSAHPRRTTHCEEINLNGLTLYAISAWGAGAARRGGRHSGARVTPLLNQKNMNC